jgi:hypothetical protein
MDIGIRKSSKPFPTSALPQDGSPVTLIVSSKNAAAMHATADHAKLYHDAVGEADKILQDSDGIRNGRGCREPKPPWLLCREGSSSWFGEMQLSCQFLLEASPWCSRYLFFVQLRTPWPPPNSGRCCSLGAYFKYKLATCMLISYMRFFQHGQSKRPKPPWWLLVCILWHQEHDLFTWLLLRRAGTVIHFFRKEGSKCRLFQSSRPHKMLKWFALSLGDLMINGLCLHQLVEDGNTLVLLIFLPDGIEKHIKAVTVASDVQGMFVHRPLTYSFSDIINLDDLVMSASPLRHAALVVYFLGNFMVLPMQLKLEPWPLSEPVQYSSTILVTLLPAAIRWSPPQPWPPPSVVLCWIICRIADQSVWNSSQLFTEGNITAYVYSSLMICTCQVLLKSDTSLHLLWHFTAVHQQLKLVEVNENITEDSEEQ